MNNYIYDIVTKECLFITDVQFPRIPVKGDFINLAEFTMDISDYYKYKDNSPCEVVTVVLNREFADIYINLNKEFE